MLAESWCLAAGGLYEDQHLSILSLLFPCDLTKDLPGRPLWDYCLCSVQPLTAGARRSDRVRVSAHSTRQPAISDVNRWTIADACGEESREGKKERPRLDGRRVGKEKEGI